MLSKSSEVLSAVVDKGLPNKDTHKGKRNHFAGDQINLFVRVTDGKTMCLNTNPFTEDVPEIKRRIASQFNQSQRKKHHFRYPGQDFHSISEHDLFLVCNGKPLSDSYHLNGKNMTLSDYNIIADGLTIHASVRNGGGCFVVSFSILMLIIAAVVMSVCTCGMSLCIIPFLLPLLFILPLFCL